MGIKLQCKLYQCLVFVADCPEGLSACVVATRNNFLVSDPHFRGSPVKQSTFV